MPAICKKGTILIPSGPSHDPGRKHLHIICTNPDGNGEVLVVSVSSWVNDLCDGTCILQAHEHDFLHQKSYVYYRRARTMTVAALELGIAEKDLVPHQDMNGQTFLRVAKGICNSPRTPRKIKRYAGCALDEDASNDNLGAAQG